MHRLTGFVLFCGIIYAGITAILYAQQTRLIYPSPDIVSPLPDGFEEVFLQTADGLELRSFYRRAGAGQPTVVYFHGNGGTLYGSVVATEQVAALGYGLLLVEYRGYGGNAGTPCEQGFYADGRAALAFLTGQDIAKGQIIVMGNSIGTGTAVQLATEISPKALVLSAPFTSLPDAASEVLWWLPVRPLIRDTYDNASKIGQITAPTLIVHGSNDTLIPYQHGEALAEAGPAAEFILFDAEGHDLIFTPAVQAAQAAWLAAL
ncbi:alpha/beta hydrolase [Pontixanthobacter sp.]|uniref:alpha/beta hydrolase n=1 Tax=Pontixanthobacter sp. TaxID=2792078 RepID=UPI003C7C1B08